MLYTGRQRELIKSKSLISKPSLSVYLIAPALAELIVLVHELVLEVLLRLHFLLLDLHDFEWLVMPWLQTALLLVRRVIHFELLILVRGHVGIKLASILAFFLRIHFSPLDVRVDEA